MRTNFNHGSGLHLLHDVAAVDFYRGLAGSDFVGNQLIEHSGDYESHNLAFSSSQRVIMLLQIVDLGLLFPRRVAFNSERREFLRNTATAATIVS